MRELLLRARIRWRVWRLQRGWIPVNGLRPGENRYARLRALLKR